MDDDFDKIKDYRPANMSTRDAALGVIVVYAILMLLLCMVK